MYELYLAHHGILGQRWGIRRFQRKDGSLTSAGKNRYNEGARHTPSNARKMAADRARNLEKARKAKLAKAEFEKNRQNALKTGSAKEVLKYKNFSTQKELQDALNRIDLERRLNEAAAKEVPQGKKLIDKVIDTADTWRARGEKVKTIWNFIASVHNSFVPEKEAWQKLGEASIRESLRKKAKDDARKKLIAEKVAFDETGKLNYDTLMKFDSLDSKTLLRAIKLQQERARSDNTLSEKKKALIGGATLRGKLTTQEILQLKKLAENLSEDQLQKYIEKKEKS